MWTCGLLSPLPVLWEDRLEHMTPVDPAGVCSQPTHPPHPGGYFGGLIEGWLLVSAVSVYSSWRVTRGGGSGQKITRWQLDTLGLHGNVGSG